MKLDWLIARFASAPERTAFIHEGRAVSYWQLVDLIGAFGRTLEERGVRAGDRVVVLGDYTQEAYALMLALAAHANVVIPLTRESVVEVDAALSICG